MIMLVFLFACNGVVKDDRGGTSFTQRLSREISQKRHDARVRRATRQKSLGTTLL